MVSNAVGNKGGVALSFMLNDTSFAFVNAHFAAHQGKVEKRNSDYKEILNGLKFGDVPMLDLMSESDRSFWMGDLNYRIDDLTRSVVSCPLISL